MLLTGDQITVSCLSTVCRRQLSTLLDPPQPLGQDWCLLAIKLGMQDSIGALESSQDSPTATLLDTCRTPIGECAITHKVLTWRYEFMMPINIIDYVVMLFYKERSLK